MFGLKFWPIWILFIVAVAFTCVNRCRITKAQALSKQQEAIVYRESNDLNQALKSINTAIRWDPNNANFYWDRALTLWKMGKRDDENTNYLHRSEADWLKVIELKQGDEEWAGWSEAYFGLAQAEYRLGEIDQGIINYEKAYQYTSDSNRKDAVAAILGYIFFNKQKYQTAIHWFDLVSGSYHEYFDSCLRNAVCNHRLNNLKRAEELYLKALAVKPDNGYSNVYVAQLYAELGEQNKVIGYLKHGLEQIQDVGLVFATLGNDNFTSEPWSSTEYLKLYDSFFDNFQDELRSYATGDFAEDSLQIKKLNAFYRSINKVVVRSLDNPNPEVSDCAQMLLAKIKEAGLEKVRKGVSPIF